MDFFLELPSYGVVGKNKEYDVLLEEAKFDLDVKNVMNCF